MIATICASAFLLLAPRRVDAQCSANITNPLQAVVGTWSLKAGGGFPISYASAGQFKASVGTDKASNQIGVLDITDTVVGARVFVSQEKYQGRYQVNADCSGGILSFNSGQNRIVYDFWFIKDRTGMYFVSQDPGLPVVGKASRLADSPCPVGNSLPVLTGKWGYEAEAPLNYKAAGQFTPSVSTDKATNQIGILDIIDTVVGPGVFVSQEKYQGRYQVNADCSGGVLSFNSGQNKIAYNFWFIEDRNGMYFVSEDPGLPILGEASFQGTTMNAPTPPTPGMFRSVADRDRPGK